MDHLDHLEGRFSDDLLRHSWSLRIHKGESFARQLEESPCSLLAARGLLGRLLMKISIFTMNGGHGTISASLALGKYLRSRGAECSVVDFMKETNPLGDFLAEIYNSLLRSDLRFASLYMELAHRFPFNEFEPANSLFRTRILHLLEREKPDAVVLICP
jgi:hypothetical protein